MMKWFKSKTINFSLLLAIFGAIEANMNLLAGHVDEKFFGIFTIAVAIIVAALRAVTDKPLSEK